MENLRAYILVKDTIPLGKAINSVAHAGCLINEKFPAYTSEGLDPIMVNWWQNKIRKVTCKVTEEQFEKAKEYEDWFVVTESTLDDMETILVFKPRKKWPKFFKFLSLYN